MSQRSKFSVDLQFVFGDALIKTGVAIVWLVALIGLYTPVTLREAVDAGMAVYLGMLGAMTLVAFGCWQWGRAVRRAATIADRTT